MPRPRQSVRAPKKTPANGSVGTSIPKLEAHDKVTGAALYLDDLRIPGTLHGRTVRSTVARGRIRKITLDPAFDWTGVTVADHKDIPGENVVALIEDDQPLLAATEIRHAEEPILLLALSAERVERGPARRARRGRALQGVLSVGRRWRRSSPLQGLERSDLRIDRGDGGSAFHSAGGGHRVGRGRVSDRSSEQLYIENNAMMAGARTTAACSCAGHAMSLHVHKALMRACASAERCVLRTVTGADSARKSIRP
jgi:xanthine dehydrogenase molybdopterin-binding subunit B